MKGLRFLILAVALVATALPLLGQEQTWPGARLRATRFGR